MKIIKLNFVVITLLLSVFFVSSSKAQDSQVPNNTIFAELGGPGIISFNFDKRFNNRPDGFGGRIGLGGVYLADGGFLSVPIGLNYLLGKDGKNYFEVGAGFTFLTSGFEDDGFMSSSFGHLNFGYRLQPKDGGFNFRASLNPIFGNGWFYPFYGGVSLGYTF
ncbi:MAG TPA: hypothetical protein PKX92_06105 [Edaphocola sp.]|nr:hypothetical protein [Edaphocola sp.]